MCHVDIYLTLQDKEDPLLVQKPITTYPRLQFVQFPDLINEFNLAPASPVQRWDISEGGWIMGNTETVLSVDSSLRLVLRLPKTLLQKWTDCPGLDEELRRLNRLKKRRGADLVSPPAKTLRLQSPSPPPEPESQTLVPSSVPPVPPVTTLPPSGLQTDTSASSQPPTVFRRWPRDYSVQEVAAGFDRIAELRVLVPRVLRRVWLAINEVLLN